MEEGISEAELKHIAVLAIPTIGFPQAIKGRLGLRILGPIELGLLQCGISIRLKSAQGPIASVLRCRVTSAHPRKAAKIRTSRIALRQKQTSPIL